MGRPPPRPTRPARASEPDLKPTTVALGASEPNRTRICSASIGAVLPRPCDASRTSSAVPDCERRRRI
ncbi:hypothetical protein M6B38_412645 [Iris pallida]|uniref:Uncharacterized protein n=1 Tax=Iris pallida TaxID=29817 RepID=A0AAX6FMB0_IRIPA|nr:hypothetical protein M6B38_226615 [Iris pallida]KAJ6817492.1 hypothetical protein M6B38_412645 [Iris pallida]